MERGQLSLAIVRPWMVAFAFGLLHGFGFAGALVELGLPQGDIPLALLAFNVGVELGQLAFIAVILAAVYLVRRFVAIPRRAIVALGLRHRDRRGILERPAIGCDVPVRRSTMRSGSKMCGAKSRVLACAWPSQLRLSWPRSGPRSVCVRL